LKLKIKGFQLMKISLMYMPTVSIRTLSAS